MRGSVWAFSVTVTVAVAAFALAGAPLPARAETGGPPLVSLSFDQDVHDAGLLRLRGETHGDEVSLAPGLRGQALFIGGTKDWLDLPLAEPMSLERGASLSLWLRRDDWTNPYRGGSGWQTVASLGSVMSLSITAPGCPLHKPWMLQGDVSHRRPPGVKGYETSVVLSRAGTVPPNAWRHAALVYDPGSATLSLYLGGVRVDQARSVSTPDPAQWHVRLGTWFEDNQAFRGLIDEVAVYDYARSPEDIAREAAAAR